MFEPRARDWPSPRGGEGTRRRGARQAGSLHAGVLGSQEHGGRRGRAVEFPGGGGRTRAPPPPATAAALLLPGLGSRERTAAAAAAEGRGPGPLAPPLVPARDRRHPLAAAPRVCVYLGQSSPSSAVWKLSSQARARRGHAAAWGGRGSGRLRRLGRDRAGLGVCRLFPGHAGDGLGLVGHVLKENVTTSP